MRHEAVNAFGRARPDVAVAIFEDRATASLDRPESTGRFFNRRARGIGVRVPDAPETLPDGGHHKLPHRSCSTR